MSFVPNRLEEQQLSLFDPLTTMTEREKKFLDRSWAKYFAEFIFPKIDESPYAVLYSDKDSRPNTPVNVQIGALLIKELTNLSDDELLESLMFDIRFQYALHTTSFAEQRSATGHSAVSAQGVPRMKQSMVWISFMKLSFPCHRKWWN